MVQEYVSPVRVHKYTFEMVMAAYERRFPNCPQIPVVVDCVITEDSWSGDDSQRYTTRRCQLNVDAPYLLKKMIGVDYVYFIQKNHLDLKNRVLEIEATNESFASRVGVVEKCRYFVHPENPEWTCFEQTALLDVKNFFGLESTVEKIAMKQYAANIAKGKELIESFMSEVLADGVKDLKPWKAGEISKNKELRRVVSRGTEPLSPAAAQDAPRLSLPGTSNHRAKHSAISLKHSRSNQQVRSRSQTNYTCDLTPCPSQIRYRSKSAINKKDKGADKVETPTRSTSAESKLRMNKKRVTLSEPVSSRELVVKESKFKECDCEERFGYLSRNVLLMIVVFLLLLVLMLSLPLSLMIMDGRGWL